MSLGDDYFDYSANNAPPQPTATLDYFFSHKKNIYCYGLAYQHFEDLKTNPTTATSKRLFTIVTGTNLVTNQLVLTYRTPQGTSYTIKKSYSQLIDQYKRSTTRAQNRSQQSQNTPPSQSYADLKQTSTDDNSDATDTMISKTSIPTPKDSTTPIQDIELQHHQHQVIAVSPRISLTKPPNYNDIWMTLLTVLLTPIVLTSPKLSCKQFNN